MPQISTSGVFVFLHFLKFFHVLFTFIWVGSLFTLSGIFLLLSRANTHSSIKSYLKKWYLSVDFPAMMLSIFFGLSLLLLKEIDWKAGWLHMKLTFAFVLIVTDLVFGFQCLSASQAKGSRGGILAIVFVCIVGIFGCIYLLKVIGTP